MTTAATSPAEIARLNDNFRRNNHGKGRRVMTSGIASLSLDAQLEILALVTTFDAFTADNDPHGEHDFGSIEYAAKRIFWRIDVYADESLTSAAANSTDAEAVRVLTIMLADEY